MLNAHRENTAVASRGRREHRLCGGGSGVAAMFLVDEAAEQAVRNGFEVGGMEGAVAALRLRYKGLDQGSAATCAEQILSWRAAPPKPTKKRPF